MEANAMISVGLVPSQQLVSLLTDDEGNWRDVPEGESVVPLVKIPKPEQGAWEPNVVWFEDRVERQWVAGTPAPVATFTAEQIVSQYFSAYQIAALQRLEMALLQAGKPLGVKMSACKQWLESVMLGWAMNPVAAPAESFGSPAATFEEASAEAVADLSNPNPEP
jgi:hypothetical protein